MERNTNNIFPFDFSINNGNTPQQPSNSLDKIFALEQASRDKIAKLTARREQQDSIAAANRASLVGQLDLNPDGIPGGLVNIGASLVSGFSRDGGQVAGLFPSIKGAVANSGLNQQDVNAYNRFKTDTASPADLNRLYSRNRPGSSSSLLEDMTKAESLRKQSLNINKTFDLSGGVHQDKRNSLISDIGTDFEENFKQISAGGNDTDVAAGLVEVAKGVGNLLSTAVRAVGSNPGAVVEYVAENIPQLVVGAFGTAGKALMSTINIGHATDVFQQGMNERIQANNGQLPSIDEMDTMAIQAVGIAISEQLGDVLTLGATKAVSRINNIQSRTNFKKAVSGTVAGTSKGILAEAPTEAIQTILEGEIKDNPATPKEIFTAAVIGGAVGGGLGGGGRGVSETAKLAAQPALPKAVKEIDPITPVQADIAKDARDTGNVDGLIDPKNTATYAPDEAIRALFGHSQKEGTTEEAKQSNLAKADQIVGTLTNQIDVLERSLNGATDIQDKLDSAKALQAEVDPADTARVEALNNYVTDLEAAKTDIESNPIPLLEATQIKRQLAKYNRQLTESTAAREELSQLVQANTDVDALITEVNTPVKESASVPAEMQAAIDFVASIDAGGVALDSRRVNSILDSLDLVVDKEATPDVSIQRLRDAISRSSIGSSTAPAQAVDRIITLAMRNPGQLSSEQANQLIDNTENKLTESQREFLRTFSDARIAENTLLGIGGVSADVFLGRQNQYKNKGIKQYRERISAAILTDNETLANKELVGLTKFAKIHTSKAKVTAAALARDGVTQIHVNKAGEYFIPTTAQEFVGSESEIASQLAKEGGLIIHNNSKELVSNIAIEADAINKALAELSAAHAIKFNKVPDATTTSTTKPTNNIPPNKTETASTTRSTDTKPTIGQNDKKDTQDSNVDIVVDPVTISNTVEDSEIGIEAPQQGLVALANKSEGAIPYVDRNILADYIVQEANREGDSTQRPLVVENNFLDSLSVTKAKEFLGIDNITPEQLAALKFFKTAATSWQKTIKQNLVRGKNPKFFYKDLMQFLIQDTADGVDIEQNVKTAMAYGAFNWIASTASRPRINGPKEINAILGRDEDHAVTVEETQELAHVGALQSVVINSMGKPSVQALGMTGTADTKINLLPQLESAMGGHVFKLLHDLGIVERTSISGEVMDRLRQVSKEEDKSSPNTQHFFIRLAYNPSTDKLSPKAEEILAANRGTQSILNRLFSVDAGLTLPSHAPIPFTQKRIDSQGVPSNLKKILEKENAVASYLEKSMWKIASIVTPDTLAQIAGVVATEDKHGALIPGIEANNNAIKRGIINLDDFVSEMFTDGKPDLDKPIYFSHAMQVTQRVRIDTGAINPQNNKYHRFMLGRDAWETEITEDNLENFLLRVGEGLGVKTDKQGNAKSIPEILDKLPELRKGIDVLIRTLKDAEVTSMSVNDQETLIAAVNLGKEKVHSLASLVNLAQYQIAKDIAEETNTPIAFKTRLMGEVDGVNNGVMLAHLLLGAGKDTLDLFGLLNRGGFFEEDNTHQQYNLWRGVAGHLDLYEVTASHMNKVTTQFISQGVFDKSGKPRITAKNAKLTLAAIANFTGQLVDTDGTVTKAARNIIKTPIISVAFGSSVFGAVDNMSNAFIKTIYASIEDTAANRDNALSKQDLVSNINMLLAQGNGTLISPQIDMNTLMGKGVKPLFNIAQVEAIKKSFKGTLGQAVQQTMERDFAELISKRSEVNIAAQATHAIYTAAETAMVDAYLQAQMDKFAQDETTGIPFTTKKGVREPIHGLTKKELEDINKKLEALTPYVQTSLTKDKDEHDKGIYISKRITKLGGSKSQITFGTPIKDAPKVYSKTTKSFVAPKSMSVSANETVSADPGVRMVPVLTHSTESATLHNSLGKSEALNIFDAIGTGINGTQEAAQNINKTLWGTLLGYSPATEVANTLERTIQGFAALVEDGTLPTSALIEVIASLTKINEKNNKDSIGSSLLKDYLESIRNTAYAADSTKLDTMAQMGSVDQYALEGGNYKVTPVDREEAVAQRKLLTKAIDKKTIDAIATIEAAINKLELNKNKVKAPVSSDVVKKTTTNLFGELGQSSIPSDPDLVSFFSNNPNTTADRVLTGLNRKYSKDATLPNQRFNLQLIGMLQRIVDPNLAINYVTPLTQERDVIGSAAINARGWFTIIGTQEAIYVVSPDFVNSGLQPELLLHELVHAALVSQVRNPNSKTAIHIKALQDLLGKVQSFVKNKPEFADFNAVINTKDAAKNLDELISWGMTNQKFQQEVLAQINVPTTTKPVTALQKFIDSITALLFGGLSKQVDINTGLANLVENVTHIISLSAQDKKESTAGNITLSMAAQRTPIDAVDSYSTLDIFNAMDNGALDTAFQGQLRGLLAGMVEKLHGPFGAFKESLRKDEAKNPLAVWLKTLDTGKAPFASNILASGFTGNNQQDFVIEQVEATVRAALSDDTVTTTELFKELRNLYDETEARITPQDFLGGAFKTNTLGEAQALYDFVFKLEIKNGNRADYLSRFAALGLAHQGFNQLLQVATKKDTGPVKAKTIVERIEAILHKILGFFHNKITNTYAGQPANDKLNTLIEQLISIEAKRRNTLKQVAAQDKAFLSPVEEKTKEVIAVGLDKVIEAFNSPAIRKSSNVFVRATGGVVRTVAGRHLDTFLDNMLAFRDSQFKGQLGIAAGLLNNAKGPIEAFSILLRARKQSEHDQVAQSNQKAKSILQSFNNNGLDLSRETKEALTSILLRSGAHNLINHLSLVEIANLLDNPTTLEAEIVKQANKLNEFGQLKNKFMADANGLGHLKATGVNRVVTVKQNAYQIVNQFGGVDTLSEQEKSRAIEVLTPLIALYAIRYSTATVKVDGKSVSKASLVKAAMLIENSRPPEQGNGIEFILGLSRHLDAHAQAKLFKNNPALMVHGYTPEIYNPRTLLVTANEQEGKDLIDQGYSKGGKVSIDPADSNQEIKHIYRLGDGGLSPQLTGVIGYGSKQAKGSKISSGYMNVNSVIGANNASTMAAIAAHRRRVENRSAAADPNRDLSKEFGNFMAPTFNESGTVVSWRYLMSEYAKDTLLERNNSFERVMGSLAGAIQGKPTTIADNKVAIIALKEQFEAEYATRGKSYLEIGPKSSDPELRSIWERLPEETKQDVREIWGRDSMRVRNDAIDIIFGYRKLSAADIFKKANTERAALRAAGLPAHLKSLTSVDAGQKIIIGVVETLLIQQARLKGKSLVEAEAYAKRAAMLVAKYENIWQGVVKEIKDILVVKSGMVLVGNIFANFTLLHLQGVSVVDMVNNTLVAFKAAAAHRADSVELDRLRTQLLTGYTIGQDEKIKRRIIILEDALARNPVNKLITEEGLMPTIVEDVDMSEDIYSFKGALARKVDSLATKVNPTIVNVARTLYMTRDGKMYQGLAHLTQMSDFVARYTLYKHQTTRSKEPLSHKEAVQRASDAFVNYDIPLHRGMQYSDDMGFTLFTKYFLYIQRELLRVTKEQPARVFLMALLNQFMNLGPIVLDSHILERIGNNPLRPGALAFPEVLDELATVSTAMAIIK